MKPPSLAVGGGPYFEPARGLLGGTWGMKPGWRFLWIDSAVGHDMELIRLEDRREDFLCLLPSQSTIAASGPGEVDGFLDLFHLDDFHQFSCGPLDQI